jgi:capsular polysaccharide transport system permease protein
MFVVRQHFSVFQALIIRDLMARFGRHHLGFLWTVLEPMILCAGVMIIWSMIKEPIVHGIPLLAFVLTGYMPLTLWRHMTNPLTRMLRNNSSILYHRPISHVDIMLARAILEFFSTTSALLVIYFVLVTTDLIEPAADPGITLAAWLFTAWYFGAMGVIISAWTEYWEPAEKFILPAQYLQLPISGVFFMVDWMPDYAQKLLLMNPSVHCFEMFRGGFLGPSFATHYDTWYLVAWCLGLTIAAAAALYHVRDRIQILG